jgi:hypothetical protein
MKEGDFKMEIIMGEKDLKENIEFINAHKADLLKEHENKYIIIFNRSFIGAFDTYEKAAQEAINTFGLEANFLIHYLTSMQPLNFVIGANF